MSNLNRKDVRQRIHKRIRRKVTGTAERPRLAVHYTNQHVYVQVIDDSSGRTLAAASTLDKGIEKSGSNVECAASVGRIVAERAKSANVSSVVFDRGGHLYHGKIKALAEAAREAGLQF